MAIPSTPIRPGTTVTGKVSWFGGPGDPSSGPTTASGLPVSVPGIALYNRATLGGYWRVTTADGRTAIVKQTDLGPAPWTGRSIDFTYTSLPRFGYTTGNFPTDSIAHATYLGKTLPSGVTPGATSGGGGGSTAPAMPKIPGMPQIPGAINFNSKGYQHALATSLLGNLQRETSSLFNAATPGSFPSVQMPSIPDPARYLQLAQNHLQQMAGNSTPLKVHPGAVPGFKGSYVNPIKGFTLGRTDMGVDANAAPGTPIRALGDSRLVQVLPNWYAGQPLLLFKLLSGPKAGQYWYVAEQINPATTQIGHVFHAGDPVATYASSGTGIEIGWGSPTSNARTLADQQGNTGGPGHSNSPAGANFRSFIGGLR